MSNCNRLCIPFSSYNSDIHTLVGVYATEEECSAACNCASSTAPSSSTNPPTSSSSSSTNPPASSSSNSGVSGQSSSATAQLCQSEFTPTWTDSADNSTTRFLNVNFRNDKFVARSTGYAGQQGDEIAPYIYTSNDGVNWTDSSLPNLSANDRYYLTDLQSTPGNFVICGATFSDVWQNNTPLVLTSSDGISWAQAANPGFVPIRVVHFAGTTIFKKNPANPWSATPGPLTLSYLESGTNWATVTYEDQDLPGDVTDHYAADSYTVVGDRLYFFYTAGLKNYVVSTPNLITWERNEITVNSSINTRISFNGSESDAANNTPGYSKHAAYGAGKLVILGTDTATAKTNTVFTSADYGATWTQATVNFNGGNVNTLVFSCERFFMFFNDSSGGGLTSTDGINWQTMSSPAGVWKDCVTGNCKIVAVGFRVLGLGQAAGSHIINNCCCDAT